MNNELNSLGINKKPSETKVVVAMSGGVDSSTVAGMMKNEGYKVIGITLKLYDEGKEVTKSNKETQSYLNSVGQVIAMGPECYSDRKAPWCKVGDHVVFGRYAGAKVSVQNVKMVIINDDEVLATLDNPEVVSQQL